MAKITLEVPDDLKEQLVQVGDRLPELLALSLQQPPLPAHIYHYILNFLASQPTPEAILAFRPTPEMQTRLKTLLVRSKAGELTPSEQQELNEYERIERHKGTDLGSFDPQTGEFSFLFNPRKQQWFEHFVGIM